MASYQDILAESTRVAQEAARMIGGTFTQGVGFSPSSKNVQTRVNAGNIGNTNAYPLPNVRLNSARNAFSSTLAAFGNNLSSQTQTSPSEPQPDTQQTSQTPNFREQILGRIGDIIGLQSRQGEKTLKYQKEENVFEKKKLAKELEGKYLSEQSAVKDRIIELEKNARGQTTQGLAAEIDKYSTESERRLADIAIRQKIASDDYNGAIEVVNSKIEAEFEPLKAEVQSLQTLYGLMQNDLTDSEKMEAQSKISQKEYEYKDLVDTKKEIATSLIENGRGDLISGLDQFTDTASMIKYAGQAGVPVDRILQNQYQRAQIARLNAETAAMGVPKITNPQATQYSGALSVILGSEKFTKEQKNNIATAINSGEDPVAVIKNQARNILGTEKTDLIKLENAVASMVNLENELQTYYANGGSSGIFRGNFEKVLNRLGTLNDPRLVSAGVKIASSLQKYRNAISGTAYSEQEGRDIASIFPGITNGQILNNAIVQARIESMQSDIDSYYRSALGTTYDSLLNGTSGQGSQQAPGATPDDPLGIFFNRFGISR